MDPRAYMASRGFEHERLAEAAVAADTAERVEQIDRAIAALDSGAGRGGPVFDDEPDRRPSRDGFGGYGRDDDWSPGR